MTSTSCEVDTILPGCAFFLVQLISETCGLPWVFHQLLHAKADALRILIDLHDLNLNGLADIQDFGRVVHPAPRHIRDVEQAIDTAQINERTVISDVLDHTFDDIALIELADDLRALLCAGLFEDCAAGDNDIAAAAIHLEDLERLRNVHQRSDIAHRAHIDLRAGQERHCAAKIDSEPTLDAAKDRAFDAVGLVESFFETVPRFFAAGLVA